MHGASERMSKRMTWQEAMIAAVDELGLDGLAAMAFEALEPELPLTQDDPDLREAARASVAANVVLIIDVARGRARLADVEPPPAAVAFTRELARRNVPVAALDRAYRVAQHEIWRWASGELRARVEDPQAALEAIQGLSDATFATGEALSGLVMARYAKERETWVRGADAIRRATVEEILDRGSVDVDSASRRLGYDLRRRHHAFVVWAEDDDALPEAAAASIGRAGALLIPVGVGVVAGWAPSIDTAAVPTTGVCVALGLPASGLDGFRRSHRQAIEARRVARMMPVPPNPVRYEDVALVALLTHDLDQAREFARRTLGPLAAPDPDSRRLADTLFAVLQAQGSPRRAGRSLGVHENTVARRLRAVDTLLDPADRASPAELLAALTIARSLR